MILTVDSNVHALSESIVAKLGYGQAWCTDACSCDPLLLKNLSISAGIKLLYNTPFAMCMSVVEELPADTYSFVYLDFENANVLLQNILANLIHMPNPIIIISQSDDCCQVTLDGKCYYVLKNTYGNLDLIAQVVAIIIRAFRHYGRLLTPADLLKIHRGEQITATSPASVSDLVECDVSKFTRAHKNKNKPTVEDCISVCKPY